MKLKLFCLISFLCLFESYSQCAMCRVVAESSQEAGGTLANGLNSGILYLMMFPYVLVLCGFIWLYLKKKEIINN